MALYCFFDLRLSKTAKGIETILSEKLCTILKDVSEISPLDFSYLDSLGCYSNTQMFLSRDNFIKSIGQSYDILFSKPIDKKEFISRIGEHNVSVLDAEALWHYLFDINNCNRLPWSTVLFDKALAIGDYGRLGPLIQQLIQPLSITEIEQRLIGYNPLWKDALSVFNSQTSRSIYLGPVAKYLGLRFLNRYVDTSVDYTIFYKVLR